MTLAKCCTRRLRSKNGAATRAISPGLNGKRVTKRSSRHTQNSVASLRAEIRDTGKEPVHVLRTTARRPLADETPQGRAVGTSRPQLCAATQLALRGQERALTKKDGKRKTCLFSTKGAMPYELFCGRSGQPLVLVFLREKFEEKKMHGKLPGKTT